MLRCTTTINPTPRHPPQRDYTPSTKPGTIQKCATRDSQTLTSQENRARAVIVGERSSKAARFVTTHKGDQILDEASLARITSLVDLKEYATAHPVPSDGCRRGRLPPTTNCGTWRSHMCMSKYDLRAWLVFHQTREAIEAHLTVVIAALAVAHHL